MPPLSAVLSTWNFSDKGIDASTLSGPDGVIGQFRNLALHSHFQPIVSLAHRRVVGHEGLLRPRDAEDQPLAPDKLFDSLESDDDIVYLDRLARNIHVRNFVAAGLEESWLFLNVNARAATCGKDYGPFFQACLLYTSPSPRDGLLSRMPSSA